MRIVGRLVAYSQYANKVFNEGIKVAKAILNVCIVGAAATAMIVAKLVGILDDEDTAEAEDAEPP